MSRSDYSEAPAIGAAIDANTKSYDRIYGMLLGIRVHVSRISNSPTIRNFSEKNYYEYEKIDIPREGNNFTPGHKGNYDYKFKTYQPHVYRALRHFFGVTDVEYLVSLTTDYMMSELKTIGRSSAMFYFTWDGRYVIKTQTTEEFKVLQRILPQYYEHVTNHPDTLVCQFYGAYRSQTSIGRKIHFVVMNNIFPIGYQIHYKFDLKGSVINRFVEESKRNRPGSTWKEAEFSEKRYMNVGPRDWALLKAQLLDDTKFLALAGVMDYSLLVGIHRFDSASQILHPAKGERIQLWTLFVPDRSSYFQYDGNTVIVRKREEKGGKRSKRADIEPASKDVLTSKRSFAQAAVMPYQTSESSKLLSFCGGLRGSNENDEPISEIYFLGIIDFLQDYGARKSFEHYMKSIIHNKDEMSCVPPDRYASRMFEFLCRTIGPSQPLPPEREQLMLRRRQILTQMATPDYANTMRPGIAPHPLAQVEKESKKKKNKKHRRKTHNDTITTESRMDGIQTLTPQKIKLSELIDSTAKLIESSDDVLNNSELPQPPEKNETTEAKMEPEAPQTSEKIIDPIPELNEVSPQIINDDPQKESVSELPSQGCSDSPQEITSNTNNVDNTNTELQ